MAGHGLPRIQNRVPNAELTRSASPTSATTQTLPVTIAAMRMTAETPAPNR